MVKDILIPQTKRVIDQVLRAESRMPLGIRQRNPGNVRRHPTVAWQGEDRTHSRPFCIFHTDAQGIRAIAKIVYYKYAKRGLTTVFEIINDYAPPEDNNNSEAYASFVADRMQFDPAQHLDAGPPDMNTWLPLTTENLRSMVVAIVQYENGISYYDPMFISWVVARVAMIEAMDLVPDLDLPIQA